MIIAITGQRGSGKDYIGSLIANNYTFTQRAFADPVKEVIRSTFKLQSNDQYDCFKRTTHQIAGNEIHGRDIVLGVGMAMRDVNPNFSIEYMSKWVTSDLVITDLRFEDEYRWCVDNGATIVMVRSSDGESNVDHISERGFDEYQCNYVIVNDKTDRIEDQVSALMTELFEKEGF